MEFLVKKIQEQKRIREEEEAKERKRKQEWAKKMQEARKQKKIEREEQERRYREELERKRRVQEEQERRYREEQERKQEEYLKSKCEFCIQLEKNCKSIGATIISEKEFSYDIFVPENIDINQMFLLFKSIVDFSLVIERTSWRILDKDSNPFVCNYYIIDIEGNKLVSFKESLSVIQFLQEDIIKEFKKGNIIKQAEKYLYCYLENRKIKRLETEINNIIKDGVNNINALSPKGNSIGEKVCSILEQSKYGFDFKKSIDCYIENSMLIIDYELPNIDTFSNVKEYKFVASTTEINEKKYPNTYISQRYDNVLYSIVLRSIYEIYYFDKENNIKSITFNGYVSAINPSIGQIERKCIISIQIDKERFSRINLEMIEPKACFKSFKGVSAAKLIDISPITPILTFNKEDKRFIEGKHIDTTQGTNLAAMHWEDFEQLVRELFELEFSQNGGEVHVTQASRDGGVDAIVFDPDPLRGGKIVIQAKRYTNTVGVSAVRDLYGTVINEGANTGILITTSDYGYDSYEFAKDKPLKLLNGGHLLALLHKNGRKAHINIEEAKKIISENNSN